MNLVPFLLVSLTVATTQPQIRKSVSFHESVEDRSERAREISSPKGKSLLVDVHTQLVHALGDLGLTNVSEDHFETVYVGLLDILLKSSSPIESLDSQSIIEQVISGALFNMDENRPEIFLPLDELLELISDNLSTITCECREKFLIAVRQRYHNMTASEQRMISSLYGNILSKIEF